MPQSDNQMEAPEQVPDEIDAALDAALEKSGVDLEQKAIQSSAAEEERRAAQMLSRSNAQQEDPTAPPPDESLVSIMAQGREHLMKRMREHAAQVEAKAQEHKPPPRTERQLSALEEEQLAGKRARERHERELASRPPPPAKEVWDGTNTPVMRPGGNVPDPTVAAPSGFAAGNRQYGPDA